MAYNTITIKGTGADEKNYSVSKRFNSVQVGVGIPLFTRGQRASVAASKLNVQLAQSNYLQGIQMMQSNYLQAIDQYNKNLKTVNYYETVGLKNADTIIQTANIQFKNGEINYLDWVLLINSAISIQSRYIDAVKNLNQSVIEFNSFISK